METGGFVGFATGVTTVGFSTFFTDSFGAEIYLVTTGTTGATGAAGTDFGTEIFSFGIFFYSTLT